MSTSVIFVPLENVRLNKHQIAGVRDQEKIAEIKSSLLQNKDNGFLGLMELPLARLLPDGNYEQAFGRHRFYSFEELFAEGHAEFAVMPLMVGDFSDEAMLDMMGVELLQHRDVSPIEEAQFFMKYGTETGKTWAETATKFEKTEEYVRGSIRLLNLPAAAQQMVTDGRLTKTTARDLLVLEKLGGAHLVEMGIDEIETDNFQNPSESLKLYLQHGPFTSWLDHTAGWFKAGKAFPHKHLPALTLGEVANLLEVSDTGEIDDVKGILTLIQSGMEVNDEAFPKFAPDSLQRVRILANPTACEKCPLHAVLDGDHYCGLQLCLDRKKEAWKKKTLDDIASKVGVPMYRKEDGPYLEMVCYEDKDAKLWKEGSPDLRLKEAKYKYNNFEGLNTTDLTAVVVGETYEKRRAAAEKKNAKAEAGNQSESEKRDIEAKKLELKAQAVMNFSWVVASHVFASSLDGINSVELMKFQLTEINEFPDFPEGMDEDAVLQNLDKMKVSDALKHMRRVLAYAMLEMYIIRKSLQVDPDKKKPVIEHAKNLEWIATLWEVKLPKDFMSQAEAYQAELDQQLKEIEPKKAKK